LGLIEKSATFGMTSLNTCGTNKKPDQSGYHCHQQEHSKGNLVDLRFGRSKKWPIYPDLDQKNLLKIGKKQASLCFTEGNPIVYQLVGQKNRTLVMGERLLIAAEQV